MKNNNDFEIVGQKGKGGGGSSAAKEDPNTLQSNALVRVLEVVSEGEIEGFATGDARSIYLNNTPVMNTDLSYNFADVAVDIRTGLPSQPYMEGFPEVESLFDASGTIVSDTNPVIYQCSSRYIDAVRITLALPNGLMSQDMSNGNLHGTSVQIQIDRRLDATGIWEQVANPTISGKSSTPFEIDYRCPRPYGAGLWSFRVSRLTPNSDAANIKHEVAVARYTEIQDVKEEYSHTAYVGIQVNAKSVGNTVPQRAYLLRGIICQVPSNYNPQTRTYTGQWNGTFKRAWTNNPAWVLYDLITNERYGLGEFVKDTIVDKFSFYLAAVYNDELVPNGTYDLPEGAIVRAFGVVADIDGNFLLQLPEEALEPRFTFNTVIAAQEDALKVVMAVASAMRSTIVNDSGFLRVNQDRPSSPVKLVTKASVIGGKFNRPSSPLQQRHTVARITYNDKSNKYAPAIATVEDIDGIQKYGYQPTDITAYGAVTQGQAIRAGKWTLDTELYTTEILEYKTSIESFGLRIGDVIKVFDEDYTQHSGGGRIIRATEDTIELDRPIELVANSIIEVMNPDGKTYDSHPIVEQGGTYSTIHITGAWSNGVPLPNASFIATTAVAPQLYRIQSMKMEDQSTLAVTAYFYDENKYSRIEQGIILSPQVYADIDSGNVAPVSNIEFSPESFTDPVIGTQLKLRVDWQKSPSKLVVGYNIAWRYNESPYKTEWVTQNTFTIPQATEGTYDVFITAVSLSGSNSLAVSANYSNTYAGENALSPPKSISIVTGHGSGTVFDGNHLFIEWEADPLNQLVLAQTVGGYRVDLFDSVTGTLLRSETTTNTHFDYTQDLQEKDGGQRRNIRVDVYTLDAVLRPSQSHATRTFSNAAPAVPSNITVTGVVEGFMVTYSRPTEPDYVGTLVWMSETNNFTPSEDNLIFDGTTTLISIPKATAGTTYYFRVAAYDTFSKSLTGNGLNLSAQLSSIPLAQYSIPIVSTLPATGNEGDLAFNDTDGKLYRYHNGAWTAAVDTENLVGTIGADHIAANSLSADKLIANSITSGQLSTGQLISTSAQIGAGVINSAAIQDAAISNAKIAVGAVDNLSIDRATANKLSIVTGDIEDAAITNVKIGSIIQSSDYVPSTSGWLINKSGFAEFQNALVRGTIYADDGYFNGKVSAASVEAALGNATYYNYPYAGTGSFTIPTGLDCDTIRIRIAGGNGGGGGGGGGGTGVSFERCIGGSGGNGSTGTSVTYDLPYATYAGTTFTFSVGAGGAAAGGGAVAQPGYTSPSGGTGSTGGTSSVNGIGTCAGGAGGGGGGGGGGLVLAGAPGANGGNGGGGAGGAGGTGSPGWGSPGAAGTAGTAGAVQFGLFKGDAIVKSVTYQNLVSWLDTLGHGAVPSAARI